MIGGFEEPNTGQHLPRRPRRRRPAAVQARREHGLPVVRAVPAPDRSFDNIAFGLQRQRVPKNQIKGRVEDMLRLVELSGIRPSQVAAALGRPAAAGRPRARSRLSTARAPPRRAARRARPQASQADAALPQAHPARSRHHVHPRHARPGGGHDDGRLDRGHERRADRAARRARGALRATRRRRSSPASSASRTSCRLRSRARDAVRLATARSSRRTRTAMPAASRQAFGRRRSRSVRVEARTRLSGTIAETAYIGVATQTRRGDARGHRAGLRAEHRLVVAVPAPGSPVTLSWSPESTFVVEYRRRRRSA